MECRAPLRRQPNRKAKIMLSFAISLPAFTCRQGRFILTAAQESRIIGVLIVIFLGGAVAVVVRAMKQAVLF